MDINKQQAIKTIRQSSLSRYADSLIDCLLPSARLVVEDTVIESANSSLVSHLGGLPSLPEGTPWPVWDKHDYLLAQIEFFDEKFKANPRANGLRDAANRARNELERGPIPLQFLGQVSLNELFLTAQLPGWPREGTLLFFCDPSSWGFDPSSSGHCRVLFFEANSSIGPVPYPENLAMSANYPNRRVSFTREWTLPTHFPRSDVDSPEFSSEEYNDLCCQLMSSPIQELPIHRCGGHPQEIQGDMRLECQLVTNGLFCGDSTGYQDSRREQLEEGASDWQLLLQVDSDEEAFGWMWGDAGRVYFWARKQDIQARNFDGAWSILQCY